MTTIVGAPARVDGIQLIGEMVGSGYRTPPALVRRHDGQTLQLTPLLYLVLDAVDGRRDTTQIAALVSRATGRHVTAENVQSLLDGHLRPLGLVRLADGSAPELKRSNPLLGLKLKFAITDPRTTHRVTDPFRVLFLPGVAVVVTMAFFAVTWWVFFDRGLGPSAYDAFERPHLLLLVFVVSVLSGGFHEFGHAAAARYGGAEPGSMGAGLYLVWPAFYTDVTDSYRLGRAGRVRTDLGGLYFNAIVAVGTFGWWFVTRQDALLLLVATQTMQMVQQLLPLLRFDGYHLLADLTGVPDLYHRMRPTLVGLLPHRWSDPENRILKPWARAVITLWVLVTIPMMALMLAALVAATPRLLGSAWTVVTEDLDSVTRAWGSGGLLDAGGHLLQVLMVVLPTLACVMILGRLGLRWFRGLAGWSAGSRPRRLAAAALSAVMVTALSWAWWPNPGTYSPITADERGLLTTLFEPLADSSAANALARPAPRYGLAAAQRLATTEPLRATFASQEDIPTKDAPQLALVLVPTQGSPGAGSLEEGDTVGDGGSTQWSGDGLPSDSVAEPWVFPFDQPLAPAEGDNQALAINTTDGSVTYDVAFAMVWAEDREVFNVNEAHAYASCRSCVTVAVAFQVVFIADDAEVVVPQNLAVAVNYECFECVTAAVASQLVLTVHGEPGEEDLIALRDVWQRLLDFGQSLTSYTLVEITAELDAFKAEIIVILDEAPTTEPSLSTATPSPSETTTDPATESPSTTTTTTTSPSPSPSPSESTTTTSPSPSPSPSPTESTTTTSPSPSPTPTESTTTTSPSPSPTESTTTTSPSPSATTTTSP